MSTYIDCHHVLTKNDECAHHDHLNGYKQENDRAYAKGNFYLANVVLTCACKRLPKTSDWPLFPCNFVSTFTEYGFMC